jgi:hypothetical protein
MRRVKLSFAGLKMDFCDRDKAIKQVEEFAERGTWHPIVVFGPEGCGKTAWLKQATELLRELGFEAIYVDPIHKDFIAHTDVKELVDKFTEVTMEAVGVAQLKLTTLAIDAAKWLISKWGKRRIAILVDDAFQAIGLDKAAMYVKALLSLVEYPPEGCEKIVAIATTSEGLSRREIGRHLWAWIKPIWNMSQKGFEEIYEKIPGRKPPFDEAWRLTGGNPRILAQLYESKWSIEHVTRNLAESKRLQMFTSSLSNDEKMWLLEAIDNPDALLTKGGMPLLNKLVELNMMIDAIPERDGETWIDEPPPERDLELGIGRYIAWQTPIHREAVKRAMTKQ